MTWLTWRQFRVPAASVYAALALIAVVLAFSGPDLVGRTDFSDMDFLYGGTAITLYLLPAVVGVFWGVPLVARELETGTHNVVWNQSITRTHWLAAKTGVGLGASVVAAGLLSVAVSWWASPIDTLASQQTDYFALTRMSPAIFAARGIAPAGYAAFAFVLGVAVGILLRRTVAAMAVTLVVFVAVMIAVPFLVRPYLLPPETRTVAITGPGVVGIRGGEDGVDEIVLAKPPGAWMLGNETVDPSGNVVSPLPDVVGDCVPRPGQGGGPPGSLHDCVGRLGDLGYTQRQTYQPAGRFWPLQWLETGLFLVLTALLTWFSFRRLRHLS